MRYEVRKLWNQDGTAWYVLRDGVVISPPFRSEVEASRWSPR